MMIRQRDTVGFNLGVEPVTVINDGGLGIRYNAGYGFVDWQPGGIRPVLSLEVPKEPIVVLITRQSDENQEDVMTLTWYTSMQAKFSQRCWARFVTRSSLRITKWDTKKFVSPSISSLLTKSFLPLVFWS